MVILMARMKKGARKKPKASARPKRKAPRKGRLRSGKGKASKVRKLKRLARR